MSGRGSLGRVVTQDQRSKASASLKEYYEKHPEAKAARAQHMRERMQKDPEGTRQRQVNGGKAASKLLHKAPDSILDLSKRTVTKILRRLGVGCSHCGWSEAVCDVHHIHGRKVPNPHHHANLTYVCPNCHRLAHCGKIAAEELMTLEQQIGDSWRDVYYPEKAGIST